MKVADILRSLVSLIDAAEQEEQAQPQQPVVVNINNGETAAGQSEEETVADDELGVMIPPLQQKIEMAKKANGVDSVYAPADDEQDELAVIKKHAGLAVTTQDEPFEG